MRYPNLLSALRGAVTLVAGKEKKRAKREPVEQRSSLERLEPRIVLSVTVKVANNDIFISGDGANNGIAVFEDAIRRLFIYGDVATPILGDGTVAGAIADTNAGGGREFDPGQYTNIYINMGSGNDLVQVAGLQSTDVGILSISTGDASGGDNVSIGQSTFAGSPDIFFGFNAVTKSVTVTGGNGNDVLSINALTAPSLTVNGGALPDVINVATSDNVVINGKVSLNLDDGGGTINVGQNAHTLVADADVHVTGGSGNDFFTLDGLTVGNVSGNLILTTGLGNDQVTLGSNSAVSVANGSIFADLGDSTTGNIFTIGANASVMVGGAVSIKMGAGNTLANAINIDNLTASGLSIIAGAADDKISIAGVHNVVIHGDVSISSGNSGVSGDQVFIGSTGFSASVDGNVSIATGSVGGNANNLITVDNSTIGSTKGNLAITTGNGVQQVSIGNQGAVSLPHGSVSIETGSGGDTVELDALTANGLAIDTGDGVDTVDFGLHGSTAIHGNGSVTGEAGAKTVQSFGSTTIDGNFNITLGDGGDTVSLDAFSAGNVAGNLTIKTGAGDDHITLVVGAGVSVPHGGVSIDTGDAVTQDSVQIGGAGAVMISGPLSIKTGNGNDSISVDFLTASGLAIDSGSGNDSITVGFNQDVTIHGDVTINTGDAAGGDAVHLAPGAHALSIDKTLTVLAGTGNNTVSVDHLTAVANILLTSGNGNNTISVGTGAAVAVMNDVTIHTGTGSDSVSTGTMTAASLTVDTGTGNDSGSLQHLMVTGDVSYSFGIGLNALKMSTHALSDVSISAASGVETITIGQGILANRAAALGPNTQDIPIQRSGNTLTASFHPLMGGARYANYRVVQNDAHQERITLSFQGTSPVTTLAAIRALKAPITPIVAGSAAKVTVPIQVTNTGALRLGAGTKVNLEVYAHNTETNEDTLITTLANESVAGLASGASRVFRSGVAIPGTVAAGDYQILVKIVELGPSAGNALDGGVLSSQTFRVV